MQDIWFGQQNYNAHAKVESFLLIISATLWGQDHPPRHAAGDKSKAQRGPVTCPKFMEIAWWGFEGYTSANLTSDSECLKLFNSEAIFQDSISLHSKQ